MLKKLKLTHWVIVISIILLMGGGFLVWNLNEDTNLKPTINLSNPEQVELGRVTYMENCASCHGDNLQGQPNWRERKEDGRMPAPPHDETGHTWHHPDDILFGITKKGIAAYVPKNYKSDMPVFGGILSDEEIWATLAYIQSRWPEETLARRQARNKRNGG